MTVTNLGRYQKIDRQSILPGQLNNTGIGYGSAIHRDDHHTIPGVWSLVGGALTGVGSMNQPYLGLFWTPYADWIYTGISLSGLLLICWLVLGRKSPP